MDLCFQEVPDDKMGTVLPRIQRLPAKYVSSERIVKLERVQPHPRHPARSDCWCASAAPTAQVVAAAHTDRGTPRYARGELVYFLPSENPCHLHRHLREENPRRDHF